MKSAPDYISLWMDIILAGLAFAGGTVLDRFCNYYAKIGREICIDWTTLTHEMGEWVSVSIFAACLYPLRPKVG